ncbi:hypothetical protein CPB85DRAFT_1311340, partial [Mucidula mucida]
MTQSFEVLSKRVGVSLRVGTCSRSGKWQTKSLLMISRRLALRFRPSPRSNLYLKEIFGPIRYVHEASACGIELVSLRRY